ncbi:MAG: 7-cyano-7-deazaguanine synthase [Aquificota bacterium]|nr:7-cyano-7-deazaguanine synthase [Aquificota bacterium]
MRKVLVLFSAGVESSCLLVHYLRKGFLVYPVYVRAGLPWEEVEREYALRFWTAVRGKHRNLFPVRTVFVKGGGTLRGVPLEDPQIEIPLRNMSLLVQTSLLAHSKGVDSIAVGSLGIYPFPDNSREYFDRLQDLISRGLRRDVRIETPFMGMEKWEVVRRFRDLVPFSLTFSCASPSGRNHCGICVKCRERKEGFRRAGVKDPTLYRTS